MVETRVPHARYTFRFFRRFSPPFWSLALHGVAFYGFWSHVHHIDTQIKQMFFAFIVNRLPHFCAALCCGTRQRDLNIDELLAARQIQKRERMKSSSSAIKSSEENTVYESEMPQYIVQIVWRVPVHACFVGRAPLSLSFDCSRPNADGVCVFAVV